MKSAENFLNYLKNFPRRLINKLKFEYRRFKNRYFPVFNQRNVITKDLANTTLTILEIGPFTQPLLVGQNIKYFDLMDKDSLIKRAESYNLDVSKIPEIDYIHPEGDLNSIQAKFDVVVSAHVIEHQPDLIRHLNAVERLLDESEEGLYRLVIPDKRYCFDAFIPESGVREIIHNYEVQQKKPDRLRVIQSETLTTHNYARRHWRADSENPLVDIDEKWKKAEIFYSENEGRYIDVHMWQFTPKSFEFVINTLHALNYTKFVVQTINPTRRNHLEFSAILKIAG